MRSEDQCYTVPRAQQPTPLLEMRLTRRAWPTTVWAAVWLVCRYRPEGPLALTGLALLLLLLASQASAQETVEYYGTDSLGSVRVVYDTGGSETGRSDYLPFGDQVTTANALPAERFTGQARDSEAGLDYFNARMLRPTIGQFTTADPLAGITQNPRSWNRYAYVQGNPLANTDPSGAFTCPAGSYWCPPSDIDKVFDPYGRGYHGGEVDAGLQSFDQRQRAGLWDSASDTFARKRNGYGTEEAAARAAAEEAFAAEQFTGFEYGGRIVESNSSGVDDFGYTKPRTDNNTSNVNAHIAAEPDGTYTTALYHTHPPYGFGGSDWWSGDDLAAAKNWAANKGYNSYLATPGGYLVKYDAKTGNSSYVPGGFTLPNAWGAYPRPRW